MNTTLKTALLGLPALAAFALPAFAEENARVISSVPVIQQVAVPQQVSQQPVVTSRPSSGAGAVIGAIAGGILGNTIGHGGGRAAATMLGVAGGAVVGDRVEGSPQQIQNMQTCSTQTTYESRTVGYNVTYEYAGQQYQTQMASDPGPYVRIQVSPVASQGAAPAPVQSGYSSYPPSVQTTTAYVQPGVVVTNGVPVAPVVYAQPYPYYAPAYRPYYYPPVGVSLNLGYSNWHGHGHWR